MKKKAARVNMRMIKIQIKITSNFKITFTISRNNLMAGVMSSKLIFLPNRKTMMMKLIKS